MNKTILTYGLLSGAVSSVLVAALAMYVQNTMDFKFGELLGYASILLSMLFVYFGVRTYRDHIEGGTWNFGKAFKVGIFITLISCVCYVVAWMVVYQTMMPDFMDKYIEHALGQLRASGATEEQIRQEAAKMEGYKTMFQNPLTRAAITFLEPFPVGSLVTLVTSFALRRKK